MMMDAFYAHPGHFVAAAKQSHVQREPLAVLVPVDAHRNAAQTILRQTESNVSHLKTDPRVWWLKGEEMDALMVALHSRLMMRNKALQ
jgi:hypothetical protein